MQVLITTLDTDLHSDIPFSDSEYFLKIIDIMWSMQI